MTALEQLRAIRREAVRRKKHPSYVTEFDAQRLTGLFQEWLLRQGYPATHPAYLGAGVEVRKALGELGLLAAPTFSWEKRSHS